MVTKSAIAIFALGAAVFSATASAQFTTPRTFYAGGNLGSSHAQRWCMGAGSASCDDSKAGFKVFGGYQLDETFAVELGYARLGKFTARFPTGDTDDAKVSALEASIVAAWPLARRIAIFGRMGAYYGTVKETTSFAGNGSQNNGDLTFGVGVRYDVMPKLAVRAEWQRYLDMGGENVGLGAGLGDNSSVDLMSVGVLWRF